MFAYLHMHIVEYYVRFATDTVTAAADGINMLTPIRDVAQQVATGM